ncbi:MAG: hypothetical protein HEQ23_14205 [Tepidisphaera sp.]
MTSQSHYGSERAGRRGWRLSRVLLALALLLSFAVQVGVRASHTHRPVERDEPRAACGGHGHHHHHHDHHGHAHDGSQGGGRDGGSEQDEDSTACEICQKLTIARFTSFVGGAPVVLSLAPRVAVGVPVEASWEAPSLAAPRAASRGPPTGA